MKPTSPFSKFNVITFQNYQQLVRTSIQPYIAYIYGGKRCKQNNLATQVWYAHTTFRVLLFFPYPSRYAQLQLFPISAREEKCHVAVHNEAVMTISDFLVTISNAPWTALID